MASKTGQAAFANQGLQGVPNTDPGPLIKLAVYPYLPTTPDHLKIALTSDAAFWIEHYDVLNQRFIAWLSQ